MFTHHTALVNGVRLHYVMGGKGEPVVLLHGWPVTWYEWRRIMPALAEHYTVIVPDMRGCGDSEKPLTGYDKRTVAEDIYQLVHQLGRERIFLVGHDIGSMVGYAYAAAYPNDVRRLVVSEFLLPGFGLEEAMDVAHGGYWHFGFHMTPDTPEALVTGRERLYLTLFYKGLAYNPAAISEADIDEYVRCYSAPGGLRGGFSHYRTLLEDGKQNRESAKTKLPMPVLTLGGDSSMKERVLKSMQPVSENVRAVVIERCGHWIASERPDYLLEQILAFFSEDY
jgi:pimeloyl-ACP methyl ester carboxylesterase